MPALAMWAAMREPMVPAPRTATRLIWSGRAGRAGAGMRLDICGWTPKW